MREVKTYIATYSLLETNDEVSDLTMDVSARNLQNAVSEVNRKLCNKYAHDDKIKSWDIQSVSLAPWEQPWI